MDIGPGDRVICVDASPCALTGARPLVAGRIYTVKLAFQVNIKAGRGPGPALILTEIASPHDGPWALERFRKLPDISEWLETSTDFEEPRRIPADAESVPA